MTDQRPPDDPETAGPSGSDFAPFFDLSLDLLCVVGLDGTFERVNPRWAAVLGWSAAELEGRPLVELVHPDDRDATLAEVTKLGTVGQETASFTCRTSCKDGSWVTLAWVATEDRAAGSIHAVARDVTIDAAQAWRLERDAAIVAGWSDAIVAMDATGHIDTWNPAAERLLGFARHEMLGRHVQVLTPPERAAETAALLPRLMAGEALVDFETERLHEDGRRIPVAMTGAPVLDADGAYMGSVVSLRDVNARKSARERDARTRTLFESARFGLNLCRMDGTWLESNPAFLEMIGYQLLLNLAVNARDAMPDGGTLRVRVDTEVGQDAATVPGTVRIEVEDTGCGIGADERQRIFDPFFTTKEQGKGTGLGLATCFGIVQGAGGTIELQSELGRGTTFVVRLPACREVPTRIPTRPRVATRGSGEVLVAEDEPAVRRATSRLLERAGYQVHAAADGDEAIRLLDELGPRLRAIVSDVVMPGRHGYDVLAHAAQAAPHAATLLLSGYLDGTVVPSSQPDVPLLWKPISRDDLLSTLQRRIAQVEARRRAGLSGPVLLIDDDAPLRSAVTRMLAAEGIDVVGAGSCAEARAALADWDSLRAVLCDLSLPDGSGGDLLEWIVGARPELAPRCAVVTGGATDPTTSRWLEQSSFPVLAKPVDPRRLLHFVERRFEAPPDGLGLPFPTDAGLDIETPAPLQLLAVEDDPALLRAWSRELAGVGFEVTTASTLAEALDRLRATGFDAVLTDIALGGDSGIDLLRAARKQDPGIPVVLVSGGASVEHTSQAVRLQATDFLLKPVPPGDLSRALRDGVDRRRAAHLRDQLLAAKGGGDELLRDLSETERLFEAALSRLRLAFQPIVRAADSSVFAYEALLRCDEPSMSPPPRLLAAAELLGRIDDVGLAVRAIAARTLRELGGRAERLFVNIHPSELRPELLGAAADPLRQAAHRVVLEITERAGLEGGFDLSRRVQGIRDLGYQLAVDDLGEGYAGLSSLVAVRPDYAKIDMSLVRGIDVAPLKRDIVAGLADMAHRSGIVVIAEGIETIEERETLIELGVDLLQGYLFAKPGPPFPRPRTHFARAERP